MPILIHRICILGQNALTRVRAHAHNAYTHRRLFTPIRCVCWMGVCMCVECMLARRVRIISRAVCVMRVYVCVCAVRARVRLDVWRIKRRMECARPSWISPPSLHPELQLAPVDRRSLCRRYCIAAGICAYNRGNI